MAAYSYTIIITGVYSGKQKESQFLWVLSAQGLFLVKHMVMRELPLEWDKLSTNRFT
jgi:hypothetical protein